MKIYIVLFVVLLSFAPAKAQDFLWQTNKHVYASGEAALIQLMAKPCHTERIIYLSLHEPNGAFIIGEQIKLPQGNSALAAFYLPDTLHSGEYRVKAYTQSLKAQNLAKEKIIYVSNRFGKDTPMENNPGLVRKAYSDTLNHELQKAVNQNIIANIASNHNEHYFLQIENPSESDTLQGMLSLSYQDKLENTLIRINAERGDNRAVDAGSAVESKGLVIAPVFKSDQGTPLKNKVVMMSFAGTPLFFKTAITNSMGEAKFLLPDLYENSSVYFSVYESLNNIPLRNWTMEMPNKYLGFQSSEAQANENILPNLDSLHWKLETLAKVYGLSVCDTMPNKELLGWQENLSGQYNFSVNTADFVSMSGFYELVNEIVPMLKVKHRKNQSYLYLYDREKQKGFENPFLFVDGIPVHNLEVLEKFGTDKVQSISVQSAQRVVGAMCFESGIVVVNSRNKNLKSKLLGESVKEVPLQALSPVFEFKGEPKQDRKEFPDFRSTLICRKISLSPGEKIEIPYVPSRLNSPLYLQWNAINQHGTQTEFVNPLKDLKNGIE